MSTTNITEDDIVWAINQMRRAARTLQLVAAGARLTVTPDKPVGWNFYSEGLDVCANHLEDKLRDETQAQGHPT